MANSWRQVNSGYWMCTGWDVWLEYGEWRVAPYHAKRAWAVLNTAKQAMAWADDYKNP